MKKRKYRKYFAPALFVFLLILCFPVLSSADKSSVTVEVPENAEKGSEIIIRINVKHSGNNFLHYTDRVYVSVNGKEIERWEFSAFNRPEAENFSREIRYRVKGPLEIVAESNCSMHGSAGPAKKNVAVR
ncbi:MAG: hypothetical protein MUO68_09725 [Desulfobacteraceae bacterium]|nr:hypothetical protein [Desulfobacteraceae bacterium]